MKKIKNSNALINEIMSLPHYQPLKNSIFCKDFAKLLDPKHQNLIAKIFIKNQILNIITLHTAGYQELNNDNTKNNIKFLIKIYAKKFPNSPFKEVNNVKIFSQLYTNLKQDTKKISKKNFIELSLGSFKNHFENKKLFHKFEELRRQIQNGQRA